MSKISQHLSGIKALIKEDEDDGSDIGPLLIENTGEIDLGTKEKILRAIKKGINADISYGDKMIAVRNKGGRKVFLVYFDVILDEISAYVVEICDEFGYKFKDEVMRSSQTQVFTIYK